MPDPAPNSDLMRSLGRLVRGLSALFWGLPAALVVCFHTAMARTDSLRDFALAPPLACTGLLVYGLWQLAAFQKQERVWRSALDFALILSLINFGLSPFLYWWNRLPNSSFFFAMVILLQVSALLFLGALNLVLRRLGAMLPDEALRLDIKQFTTLNFNFLGVTFVIGSICFVVARAPQLPVSLQVQNLPLYMQNLAAVFARESAWLPVILVVLPLAMTMALLWKTKEVILDSVFSSKPGDSE
ncbi:MAG TPA: hypothetical protein VN578_06640 [Candidatus Binatia bacterium]|jgi:hypothetical protein|nr:hypothetical protein [Candidatus Binatia bacterium]